MGARLCVYVAMYSSYILTNVILFIFLCRYDRFIDAFEHVANMIDDIYKVLHTLTYNCTCISILYSNLQITQVPKLFLVLKTQRYV